MTAPNAPDPALIAEYVLVRQWVGEGEVTEIPAGSRIARTESDDVTRRLLLWLLVPVESGFQNRTAEIDALIDGSQLPDLDGPSSKLGGAV